MSRFYIFDKPPPRLGEEPFSVDFIRDWVQKGCLPSGGLSFDHMMPICEITECGEYLGHGRQEADMLGLVFNWPKDRNCYTAQPEMWSELKEVSHE
jgi:hypothetical protein